MIERILCWIGIHRWRYNSSFVPVGMIGNRIDGNYVTTAHCDRPDCPRYSVPAQVDSEPYQVWDL